MEEIYKTYLQALPYFVCLDGYFEVTERASCQVLSETGFYPCFYLEYLRSSGLTGSLKATTVVLKPRETVKLNKDIVIYKIVVLRWSLPIQKNSEDAVGFLFVLPYILFVWQSWLHWAWHGTQSRKLLLPLANVLGLKWWQVMVLQVPDKGREPLSTQVENYFRMNHPDNYLTHQVRAIISYLAHAWNFNFHCKYWGQDCTEQVSSYSKNFEPAYAQYRGDYLSFNIKNQAILLTPRLWRIGSKHASLHRGFDLEILPDVLVG